jgi:predicted GIY-YIG superfamily endonuclease
VESLVNELHSSTTVYIVECKELRAVKIGMTGNLTKRMSQLRQGIPVPVDLITAFAAPAWVEEKLHAYLASYGVKGEWFRKEGEVLAIIKLAEKADVPGIAKKLIAAGV